MLLSFGGLKRGNEAAPWFEKAVALDPKSYYLQALLGWHYAQLKDWPKAKEAFERSLVLNPKNNPIATSYLPIVEQKIAHPDPAP